MKRRERTRILIEGDRDLRRRLCAEALETADVYTVAEPAPGLVMTTMRESARRSRFFLGEVMVTEAKVRIGTHLGLGIIAGDDPDAAYELAVIDAAFNARLPVAEDWVTALQDEAARIEEDRAREEARILKTRVDFQTMDVQ